MFNQEDLDLIVNCLTIQLAREQLLVEEKSRVTKISDAEMKEHKARWHKVAMLIEKIRVTRGAVKLAGLGMGAFSARHRNSKQA